MPRGDATDLADVILVVAVSFIILFVGIAVASTTIESTSSDDTKYEDAVLLGDAGELITIADRVGQDETVYNSRGHAVNLAGTNDSFVRSEQNVDFADDDTWTLSTWASVSPNAQTQTRSVVSLNGRVVVTYYPMQGNWSAWYYDDGSTNSYVVNVSTSGQPGALNNVIVWSNATHLAIYRNNTVGDIKNITTDSIVDAPVSPTNWHGRLDEVRVFDDSLNSSQRATLVNSPNAPLPKTNRTARIMFDEPDRSAQRIFFAPSDLTTSNVSFTVGLPGEVMDGASIFNDVTGATDYQWDVVGPKIRPVAGGELDGAPVAYVDYTSTSQLDTFVDDFENAVITAGLIPIVFILGYIVHQFRSSTSRRR